METADDPRVGGIQIRFVGKNYEKEEPDLRTGGKLGPKNPTAAVQMALRSVNKSARFRRLRRALYALLVAELPCAG